MIKLTVYNNYSLWETQGIPLIESQDLLGFLTRDEVVPAQHIFEWNKMQITNPNYTTWVRIYHLVKSWIIGIISKGLLGHVGEVWKALTDYFTQNSLVLEFNLLPQLQHIRKDN